ncbi:hypothetical protein KL921_002733 [Ogataea angusta]|uniref:Uncharacterized protein n=1 Tax=Pichia angusta TaxID=870730 RepID=A0ABQ7RYA2_PICAN|nr:hypothetical protein KL921_002733 [Ogataea angusta]KAG7840770.1 hypothetical protein KL942_001758 [Ogataea angusta]KAG7850079.1 hypothetical protein KL940_002447 [Ogataea angusta]KAG7860654.1 hypothetical protein KL939_001221 [Ogataea angusta]
MSHRASGAIIEWGCVGGTCNNPEGSKPGNVTLDACQQTLRGLRKPALLAGTVNPGPICPRDDSLPTERVTEQRAVRMGPIKRTEPVPKKSHVCTRPDN